MSFTKTLSLVLTLAAFATPVVHSTEKPNIILIVSDDQGYAET